MTPNSAPAKAERVGIVLVHGVGEQRRFEHLDGETRSLIAALRTEAKHRNAASGTDNAQITVEIAGATDSTFLAGQDTWTRGPQATVRIIAKGFASGDDATASSEIHFHVHEVWWADVNEPYSLSKQVRFWLWGLSIWRYPGKEASSLPSADLVMPPNLPGNSWLPVWTRLRLLGLGVVFALLGFSIGTISFLLKRLFDLDPPQLLQTITNYVSGVKLYNQRRRFGLGLVPSDEEFLDTIGEPPRVSIRRRMIRAIAEVACNDYDRWYVLAHSLGSVAAFNGLMETSWAWPGYLDQPLWQKLVDHRPPMAGPPKSGWTPPTGNTVPQRPVWGGTDIAYRQRIFECFRGLLTYGCPLEKFAAIWPARVPISRTRAFGPDTVWVNVFDPVDPISGVLKQFSGQPPACCPHPQNVGYAASSVLLLSHIRYLTPKKPVPDLATSVMRWLLGGIDVPGQGTNTFGRYQFKAGDRTARLRSALAWATWIAAFLVLAGLGGFVLPLVLKAAASAGAGFRHALSNLFAAH